MKILVNAPFSDDCREIIAKTVGKYESCEVVFGENTDGADIIVGENVVGVDCTALKLLQLPCAGAERFCGDALPENVIVTNVTGAFGDVIAEYIVGGIFALGRRFFDYRENQKRHIWRELYDERTICGARVLILGCGDLGSSAAVRLRAFGAAVVGIRKNPLPADGFDEIYTMEALDRELSEADIVIGCLPKTPETTHILNRERIGKMKHGAVLVNVGRGSLVDTEALADALREGKIAGAVLDVFEEEPLPEGSPLWDFPNVFVTPHISGKSFRHFSHTERRIAEICAENIARYIGGKPLRNVIDRKSGYAVK